MTRRIRLRLLAAAGLVLVLAGLLVGAHGAGLRLLWFTSGSMSPTIAVGSLAVAHAVPSEAIRTGDILSVVADGERVTHRVVAIEPDGAAARLVLRGDANAAVDPVPYVVEGADAVLFAVSPHVLALVAGALVALAAWARLRKGRPRARWTARIAAGAAAALAASLLGAVPTTAFWTDQVTATSGSFSAGTVPAPGSISCGPSGSGVRLAWANPGARFDYRATLHRNDTGAQVGAAMTLSAGAEATLARDIAPGAFGSAATLAATGQTAFVIRIVARPVGSTTWNSAASAAEVNYQASYTTLRCGLIADTSTTVDITSIASDSGTSATDYITNVATQAVRGTGEAGATVVLTRDGASVGTATVAADGTWSIAGVTLTEGAFPFVATATDPAGNTATDSQSIRLDTIAPAFTPTVGTCGSIGSPVASPAPGGETSWCRSNNRTWSATVTESGSGLQSGTLQSNNMAAGWQSYTAGANLAMGQTNGGTMQVRATDVAGNVGTFASGAYYIDSVAPTITVDAPSAGILGVDLLGLFSQTCGSASSVGCGDVTDATSGPATLLTNYSLERDPVALGSTQCYIAASNTYGGTPCTLSQPVTISGGRWVATGNPTTAYSSLGVTYTFVVRIADAAGNTASRTASWLAAL